MSPPRHSAGNNEGNEPLELVPMEKELAILHTSAQTSSQHINITL